jgi:hypothetical protein
MKASSVISVVFWSVVSLADARAIACDIAPLPGAQNVMGSPWVAHADIEVCGFLTSTFGKEEIWLKNTQTGAELLLAEGDPGGDTYFNSSQNGKLVITIPNRSGIISEGRKVDGVNIVFHFSPSDDPDDRKGFLFWYKDQHSKEGVRWYCKSMYENASEAQKTRLNTGYGSVCPEVPRKP